MTRFTHYGVRGRWLHYNYFGFFLILQISLGFIKDIGLDGGLNLHQHLRGQQNRSSLIRWQCDKLFSYLLRVNSLLDIAHLLSPMAYQSIWVRSF